MLWLSFKLSSCLLGNTKDTSVLHEKAKFVCFIYMQKQKVKFKFVQINMKQVLYLLLGRIIAQMPRLVSAFDVHIQETYLIWIALT